jgi:hypothetical protein
MSPWRAGMAQGSATRSDASDELIDVPRALTPSVAVAQNSIRLS